MRNQARSFWEEERLTLQDAISLTEMSLAHYGANYKHWCVAFSGGKDSNCDRTHAPYRKWPHPNT